MLKSHGSTVPRRLQKDSGDNVSSSGVVPMIVGTAVSHGASVTETGSSSSLSNVISSSNGVPPVVSSKVDYVLVGGGSEELDDSDPVLVEEMPEPVGCESEESLEKVDLGAVPKLVVNPVTGRSIPRCITGGVAYVVPPRVQSTFNTQSFSTPVQLPRAFSDSLASRFESPVEVTTPGVQSWEEEGCVMTPEAQLCRDKQL